MGRLTDEEVLEIEYGDMDKRSFLIAYVLKRARAVGEGLEGALAAAEAEAAWDEIQRRSRTEH